MFICLPILFGVQTKQKRDGDKGVLNCPRCHNGTHNGPALFSSPIFPNSDAVQFMKRTQWFELFFIPIIPVSSKRVYVCTICQWSSSNAPSTGLGVAPLPPPYTLGYVEPNRPGYRPVYITPKYSPPKA
ncbi:hypothetical protein DFP72DRAFT_869914 [Ephemerocybe angulata]|uniref:Zinc-ribbon 15 domain-containing protein n=1 Tax=Ephemerocybe angulata TaxID=980116 RepID=A0A8H6IIG9_9AGAR|nr:hypothetical protein DFP72DRAFT_869914 [Tulosesus angulatus]